MSVYPDRPVAMSQRLLELTLPFETETKLELGGIWGHVQGGQVWNASDGRRLVLEARPMYVIFLGGGSSDGGSVYIQSSRGFRGEVTTWPFVDAGRRLRGMQRVAELEIQVIVGIVAATSGVGFLAVVGADVLAFVANNHRSFPKWSKAISTCLSTRAVLKRHAPTLYEKLIDALLLGVWRGAKVAAGVLGPDAAAEVPGLMLDPKIAGRGVGAIIGKIGKSALAQRLTVLSVVFTILVRLALAALAATPGAFKLSAQEKAGTGQEILEALKQAGVALKESEIERILDEVARNPKELREALERLRDAFAQAGF